MHARYVTKARRLVFRFSGCITSCKLAAAPTVSFPNTSSLYSTGVARGGLRGLAPQRMRKNIEAGLVNLTLNMRYKNEKKYQTCHHHSPDSFFQAQNTPKSVFGRGYPAGGVYVALPDPVVGWGGGYPLPITLPARRLQRLELGAYCLQRLGSQAPLNAKSWLRQCYIGLFVVS